MTIPHPAEAHLEAMMDRLARLAARAGAEIEAAHGRRSAALSDTALELSVLVLDLHRQIAEVQRTAAGMGPERFRDVQRLRARCVKVREVATAWRVAHELIEAQNPAPRHPLVPDPPGPRTPAGQRIGAMDRLLRRLHGVLNEAPQSADAEAADCFADIPVSTGRFMGLMTAAGRLMHAQGRWGPRRFLDVGCGGGMTLYAASQFFGHVAGVEYDAAYVEAARALMARAEGVAWDVHHADGLTFEGYGDPDVIYAYRPIKDDAKLMDLTRRVLSTARPHAIVVALHDVPDALRREAGAAPLGPHLYLAHASAEEARKLVRRASRIGMSVEKAVPLRPGPWQPILAASARRGFAVPY